MICPWHSTNADVSPPEQLRKDSTDWVWFMTWHTSYITDNNDVDDLKAIYNDDYVITLDELPKIYK